MASWVMYAQHQDRVVDGREFFYFGDREWVEMCYGGDVQAVELVEDPEGQYWGWLPVDDDEPTMVQPHYGMFSMQFAYGPDAEVDRGNGQIVRLSVYLADDDELE